LDEDALAEGEELDSNILLMELRSASRLFDRAADLSSWFGQRSTSTVRSVLGEAGTIGARPGRALGIVMQATKNDVGFLQIIDFDLQSPYCAFVKA
jgi:hypothetical protein